MKLKKILSVILTGFIISFIVPITVSAETEGNYTYAVADGYATITGYNSSLTGDVTLPDTLGGYPVKAIDDNAFFSCTKLTGITIPNSVTSIGEWAFYNCSELTEITIPNSVTNIGEYAFYACQKVASLTIGNHVETIGNWAFAHCDGLTDIYIPASVTSIGNAAFGICGNVESITVDASNTVYCVKNNCLIKTESKELVQGFNNSTIPADGSVTSICDNAFYQCGKLTTLTIPDSVTKIGENAFFGCTGLTDLTIGAGIQHIGIGAFYSCEELTSIVIPDGVKNIEDDAFGWCSKLESVSIPNSVTRIGNRTFNHCVALTDITIPDSVKSIGDYAFYYCTGLKNFVIPSTVTDIGDLAFDGCTNLVLTVYPNSYALLYADINAIKYHISIKAEDIPPTCTEDGLTGKTYCSICNEILNPGKVIPATGHTLGEWVIEKQPTDSSEGLRVKRCTICGEELEREVIPSENINATQTGDSVNNSQTGDKVNDLQTVDNLKSPQTGNESNILLWVSLVLISGLSAVGIITILKRKEKVK